MKRILYLSMALALLLSLTACGGSADTPSTSAPSGVTSTDENLPADGSETESEVLTGAETTEEDPLLLSFNFPNAGIGDDGTNNPPQYIVTLHGGVEVEMQPGVENQIVKLDGFGKTSNSSSSVGLYGAANGDGVTFEIQVSPSLAWSDIEAVIRQTNDLRDDVVFRVMSFVSGEEECQPQELVNVMAEDDFGNGIPPEVLVLCNPTEEVLPLTECSVAAFPPVLPNGSSDAKSIYEYLGEPACAQLTWDKNSVKLNTVRYYWVCDGFYARYTTRVSDTDLHLGSGRGELWFIVDNPTAAEYYMADVAAFLNE